MLAAYSSNALDPESPQARAIFDLSKISFTVFLLIWLIVTGGIVYAMLRFRWRAGDADPKQIAGNKKIETTWTAIPFLIVIFLFVLTIQAMNRADPPPSANPDVIITGHQFWWQADYPASGVTTANEIHIPAGKPVCLRLESTDVLHEFWVPKLTRKMTTVPGQPNHIWIQADHPGTYIGQCSEFCGVQHAWMRILVVADEPAQFAAWEQAQLQPALATTNPDASQGAQLFRTSTCINCHAVKGMPDATSRVAPDLTHIASRRQLASGAIDNTPDNMRRWVKNPQSIKPGALMPDFYLKDEQVNQLAEYLSSLR